MKLLLVIDHLGLGGAQRQIVELACGLAQRGHTVELFNYFPEHDFFLRRVSEHGIAVHSYRKGKGFSLGVVGAIASLLRRRNFDVVLSFLNNPNLYSEMARLTSWNSRLVVCERSSNRGDHAVLGARGRRLLHAFADRVVANSETHAAWLRTKWWLRGKVSCIYNGLDLQVLAPARWAPRTGAQLRLLAVGRVCPEKNLLNLIAALRCFHKKHGFVPELNWAGKKDTSDGGQGNVAQVEELLQSLPEISARWHWLGEQLDMPSLLREHDMLIHASLYEGLPNAVCEALAAGLPVLISDVCDHAQLVADGDRGYLFDPNDPQSIAASIEKAVALDPEAWLSQSRNARAYAETHLGIPKMVDSYERLFVNLSAKDAQVRTGTTAS